MRGEDEQTGALFSYVSCEARVPADHPLRRIRAIVDEALEVLSPDFDGLYAQMGRPSIAPEKLLRALLLQAFYSVAIGAPADGAARLQPAVPLVRRPVDGRAGVGRKHFSKNRERLLAGDVAQRLLAAVLEQPRVKALMSDEHFSVDGTLIQAWASHKSFQPKPASEPDRDRTKSRQDRLPPEGGPARPAATRSGTGAGGSAAMKHMQASQTGKPGSRESRTGKRASWPMPGMC